MPVSPTHKPQEENPGSGLLDSYHRNINYMRISVTDRCNLRCGYCVSRTPFPKLSHDEILSYEEILRIVTCAVDLGITKFRVTGGEPLVRKGVFPFLASLSAIKGVEDLSITTNGILLENNLETLRQAGVRRLNISLDTLKRDRYTDITGHDGFEKVWRSIMGALDAGFAPVKINVVALPGINEDEFARFAALSLEYPLHIRFIEYMPLGNPQLKINRSFTAGQIREKIETLGELVPVTREKHDGPARRYRFAGAPGEVGFISPVSNHFCETCNRLRLTANGMIRACLLSDRLVDIGNPLRRGGTDDQLKEILVHATAAKNRQHTVSVDHLLPVNGRMSSIGG